MHILFEEDGAFKTGTIASEQENSLQVEAASGKRLKVKSAAVLLRFSTPLPSELLSLAQAEAETIEVDFLWEVAPEQEFGFQELAAEYYGHAPNAIEATAVLLRLHAAPIYFHRKGKGRFRRAPPEILKAALASLEKKRQIAAAIERMAEALKAGRLPEALTPLLPELLYKPDRNKPETKALEAACAATGESAERLLFRCGAIRDTHDYHLGRFLYEHFPPHRGGVDFPPHAPAVVPTDLPVAQVSAFSIDDVHTTEIDDAFSVARAADGGFTVGIHIAAPALGFTPDSDLGRIARERLSTVYMPGRKITMLPEAVIDAFTLSEKRIVPALSVYFTATRDLRLSPPVTRIEAVPIAANLRHHDLEPLFNERTLAEGVPDFPFAAELKLLWELATVLAAGRGAIAQKNRRDFLFRVDWQRSTPWGAGWVTIEERPRGSPLDLVVAELMILANSTWGALLDAADVPALYRAQSAGRARMSTSAAAHEGLGLDCYAWCTSPLRRYADLLNQWQLIAVLRQEKPPFAAKSAELFAALRDFEHTYASYADFQRRMEHYWCLRWLLQEGCPVLSAEVLKEGLVRAERLPLVAKASGMPEFPRGARVLVSVRDIDLLAAEVTLAYRELLAEAAAGVAPETEVENRGD
ncbi:MAG: RNB domain-containing ribonuclease [Rhodocyclaceae bacterium]|nr:RNB domain-containing ribonuclease [Rhodocyclaceae bacterium]